MIHFVIPILQPYRINFYSQLQKIYKENIMFHYGVLDLTGRYSYNKAVSFVTNPMRERRFKLFSYHINYWENFWKIKFNKGDILIVQPILGNLSISLLVIYAKIKRIKIVFWVCAYQPTHNFFLKKFKNFIVKILYSFADKFICYSDYAAKYCLYQRTDKANITVAYNGIDLPKFFSKKMKSKKIKKIGYLGALIKEKGVLKLLEASKYIKIEHELHVIGDGKLKDYLHKKFSNSKNIIFYGRKHNNEEFLSDLDLLVVPGQGGLVVLESIYQNTYVLVSNNADPAVNDVLIDNVNGDFFDNNISSEELANLISGILKRNCIIDDKYGRKLISEKFTTKNMKNLFVNEIDSLIKK